MLSSVSPRFGAIQATARMDMDPQATQGRIYHDNVIYTLTFETPDDIADAAAFLKTCDAIAKSPELLDRGNLKVEMRVAHVGEKAEGCIPFFSLQHSDSMHLDTEGIRGFRNAEVLDSFKKLLKKLPLKDKYKQHLEMAAHNLASPFVEGTENKIVLPGAVRVFRECLIEGLKQFLDQSRIKLTEIGSDITLRILAGFEVLIPQEIQKQEALIASGQ